MRKLLSFEVPFIIYILEINPCNIFIHKIIMNNRFYMYNFVQTYKNVSSNNNWVISRSCYSDIMNNFRFIQNTAATSCASNSSSVQSYYAFGPWNN